jgi:hypothetical protein
MDGSVLKLLKNMLTNHSVSEFGHIGMKVRIQIDCKKIQLFFNFLQCQHSKIQIDTINNS